MPRGIHMRSSKNEPNARTSGRNFGFCVFTIRSLLRRYSETNKFKKCVVVKCFSGNSCTIDCVLGVLDKRETCSPPPQRYLPVILCWHLDIFEDSYCLRIARLGGHKGNHTSLGTQASASKCTFMTNGSMLSVVNTVEASDLNVSRLWLCTLGFLEGRPTAAITGPDHYPVTT
jgi:hypothetical protein